jgi:hypothetical protein
MINIPEEFRKYEFLLVNGILTKPSDIHGWTDRGERWYQDRLGTASRYEYFSGAITRFISQGGHVRDVVEIIEGIHRPVIYVGHSNGCEIFSRVVKKRKDFQFDYVHLFAPAVDRDFEENGFNQALIDGRIGKLFIYGSYDDSYLKNGHAATGWLKRFGMGYGDLGYHGPENLNDLVSDRVVLKWREWKGTEGHSEWWKPIHIDESLQLTLRT